MYKNIDKQVDTYKSYIKLIRGFIEHNENLNYINEDMTIKEFKEFLNNIDNKYLKIIEEIDSFIKSR